MLTYQIEGMETDVTFAKQLNGYNKEQVDSYIGMLGQSYQTLFEEHTVITGKYNSLHKTCEQLEEQSGQSKAANDALAKTLVNAEIAAQRNIESAEAQARRIIADSEARARQIISDAHTLAEKIINDAAVESEKIKGDACIEKLAAKRSIEAANESLMQTINKLQNLRVS